MLFLQTLALLCLLPLLALCAEDYYKVCVALPRWVLMMRQHD